MIYFLQDSGNLNIKIGWVDSEDESAAETRRRQLQTGNSDLLVVLGTAPGDRDFETQLQIRFAEHKVTGEWFRPVPELLQLIFQITTVRVHQMRAAKPSRMSPAEIARTVKAVRPEPLTRKDTPTRDGVAQAWGSWIYDHPISATDAVRDGVESAVTKWLNINEVIVAGIIKGAVLEWLNRNGDGALSLVARRDNP